MSDAPLIIANADAPPYRWPHGLACAVAATVIGLTQGLGLHLVAQNLSAIQGALGASAVEASWLNTAYFATALSSALLLAKYRQHFGLRSFANLGIGLFLLVAALHLAADRLPSAIALRAALGFAAAPLSTLAVLYMVQAFPPALAPVGLLLGFATLQLGAPLSRVLSEDLLQEGQWHGLFLPDVGLALLSLAAVNAVSLKSEPRQPAFRAGDAVSFPLYATGLALICVAVSQGTIAWWTDRTAIGVALATGLASLGAYAMIDLQRRQPLLDLVWLTRPDMLRFLLAVLFFRIVLAEQTVGVVGLQTLLGQGNPQMRTLFLWISFGTIAGFLVSIALAARGIAHGQAVLAAALMAAAAAVDTSATAATRPSDLIVSQTLLAVAASVFFAASCLLGFAPVLRDGMKNIVSFLAAFTFAHFLGSVLGTALLSTLVAEQTRWHYAALTQHLSITDPLITERLTLLARSVAGVISGGEARDAQALSLLAQQTLREASVLAYLDAFRFSALLALALVPWLAWLTLRARRRVTSPSSTPPPTTPPS